VRFIQHIPEAMFHSLGFMAILFLIFECIQRCFKMKAQQKYWLSFSFYCIAFIDFAIQLFGSASIINNYTFIQIEQNRSIQWMTLIGFIYVFVLFGYLIFLGYKVFKLQQLKASAAYNIDEETSHLLQVQLEHIGTNRSIKIGYSNQITGPITFGFIEPVILLPFSLLNQMSSDEMKYILLHELAHIVRNDYVMNLFVEIGNIFLCFNPFSYYFSKTIRTNREKACDEWVVEKTKSPLLYSKALYQLATYGLNHPDKLSLAAVENESALLDRVKNINGIKTDNKFSAYSIHKIVLAIFLTLFVFIKFSLVEYKANLHPPTLIPKLAYNSTKTNTGLVANPSPSIRKKARVTTSVIPITLKVNTIQDFENNQTIIQDSIYNHLINETIAWINDRAMDQNGNASFVKQDLNTAIDERRIAEKLLLTAIINKYELKRAILANAISKAYSKEEAIAKIVESNEWLELQQYEKWASSFLKQHTVMKDSCNRFDF
jgi:beta-lactamase regulating signal transducer with metallopeptidase domain